VNVEFLVIVSREPLIEITFPAITMSSKVPFSILRSPCSEMKQRLLSFEVSC